MDEEVAELARMDADLEAFRACTDASGQEVNEPMDPFEEDPFRPWGWAFVCCFLSPRTGSGHELDSNRCPHKWCAGQCCSAG